VSAALEHILGPHTVSEWRQAAPPPDGSTLELILGHFVLSPSPGGPHQYAVGALYRALWSAAENAASTDLHVLPGAAVEISTAWRTALVPDVAVLAAKPHTTTFQPEDLVLAVEVWSPGNKRPERELKVAGYAGAGVEYLWTVELGAGQRGPHRFRAHRLAHGVYREELVDDTGAVLDAVPAPFPVRLDTSRLYLA
jgi:Uma2 family endonuclease